MSALVRPSGWDARSFKIASCRSCGRVTPGIVAPEATAACYSPDGRYPRMTATRLPRSSIGHSVAIISVIVTFAVVVFWFVFVALMTVVVANDGIVVRIPVLAAWHIFTAMFFMPVGIIFVTDHLIAANALLGTVVVGLAYFGTLGFLAFVPSIIVFNILRHETGTDVVLFGIKHAFANSALGDSHPRLPILERRVLVS